MKYIRPALGLLLLGLIAAPTSAQNISGPPNNLTAPVITGTVTGTYTLGGTPTITGLTGLSSAAGTDLSFTFSQTTPASFSTTTGTIDNTNAAYANARVRSTITTLQPSADTNNIWEGAYLSNTIQGTHNQIGEVNGYHSIHTVLSGATATQIEDFEASASNFGTIVAFNDYLGLFDNNAHATVTGSVFGYKAQLSNRNLDAGSIAQYAAYNMEALANGGSVPTDYKFLRGADSAAASVMAGVLSVGSLTAPTAGLRVQGTDTSGSTQAFGVYNSTPATLFQIFDNGDTAIVDGVLKLGQANNWGKLYFGNTTSGTLQLSAPSTGALGSNSLTLPNVSDTLAVLGTQTFTGAEAFSGSIALTGTTLPTQAAGTLGIGGNATTPTLAANGEGNVWLVGTTGGIGLIGKGSTNDFTLLNAGGTSSCVLPTGTTAFNCASFVPTGSTAPTVGIALPAAARLGLYGTTSELFSGATDVWDYGVTTASVLTLPVATTLSNASVILSGITTGTNADVLCIDASKIVRLQAAASCTISSMRFKNHITELGMWSSLDTVLALNPKTFFYNNGDQNPDQNAARIHVGLIAEDVARIDPRLAIYEPDMVTPKSWHLEGMIAELVGAVQAQEHKIERLEHHRMYR